MTTNFKIFIAVLIAFFVSTIQFHIFITSNRDLHVIVSALLFLLFSMFIKNPLVAMLLAFTVGLGKEIYDPIFDQYDLLADAVGIMIGMFVLCVVSY